ncbi:hypothetical protein DCO48_03520 [Pseudomonas sp. SDI]|uniref:hypothetical protein n=1 Tax=Pseudomonas sp. SDI TaxID=2170734 RepID=UPI000DE6DDA3|nr:hypothetical protein [Pseudomonas sp. SDI]PWB35071.1 hypothetical protein DCO48_03520 [Pseudomonas sp. SDI]
MTLFFGFLAVSLFVLLIGFIWPIRGRIDVLSLTTLTVAKSLWLSWLVVFVSYWLNLGDLLLPILLVVGVVTVRRFLKGNDAVVTFDFGAVILVVVLLLLGLLLSPLAALKPIFEGEIVLSGWDVNASWNNWAMQLYENTYAPYSAAYPLFLPGLWSLVYKAQANPMVWVMTRLLLCVFPLLLVVQIGSLSIARRPIAALLVFLSVWGIFLLNPHLLAGITDPIVMMITLIAGVALYLATCCERQDERIDQYTLCAALFAGIGAITKQPGALGAVVIALGLILIGLRTSKGFGWYLTRLIAMVIPPATFMIIFSSAPSMPAALGNLTFLMSLTSKASAGGGIYENGWNLVVSMFGRFPLLLMLTLAAFNLLTPKRLASQIGLIYLVFSGIAFTAYANCCAYDERNGWFLIALLGMSAICGASILERPLMRELAPLGARFGSINSVIRRQRSSGSATLQLIGIALAIAIAGALQLGIGESRYLEAAKEARRGIVWPTVNSLVYTDIDSLGDGLIISNYQFVALLPDMEKRHRSCANIECVVDAIKQHPGSRVLMGPESFSYPALRASLGATDYLASEDKYGFVITRSLKAEDLPAAVLATSTH